MITLDVAAYCHNCDGFEPVKITLGNMNGDQTTVVRCENNRKCFAMYRHIEKTVKTNIEEQRNKTEIIL